MLDSDKIYTRSAGVLLLERLSGEPDADRRIIWTLIGAFLEGRLRKTSDCPPIDPGTALAEESQLDVGITITVIAKRSRDVEPGEDSVPIGGVCLAGLFMQAGANLTNVEFAYDNLTWSSFNSDYMRQVSVYRSDLTSARFRDCDMVEANLSGANLTKAELSRVNLARAFLPKANLTDALLDQVNLAGANLKDTNLTGTTLTDIYYDESTIWPAGFTPPPSRAAPPVPR